MKTAIAAVRTVLCLLGVAILGFNIPLVYIATNESPQDNSQAAAILTIECGILYAVADTNYHRGFFACYNLTKQLNSDVVGQFHIPAKLESFALWLDLIGLGLAIVQLSALGCYLYYIHTLTINSVAIQRLSVLLHGVAIVLVIVLHNRILDAYQDLSITSCWKVQTVEISWFMYIVLWIPAVDIFLDCTTHYYTKIKLI